MDEDAARALADVRRWERRARTPQRIAPRMTLVRALLAPAILLVATVPDDGVRYVLLGVSVAVGAAFLLALRVPQWASRLGMRALSRSRRLTRDELVGVTVVSGLPVLVSSILAAFLVRLGHPYAVVVAVTFAVTASVVVVGDLAWNRWVVPPAGGR